MRKKNAILYLEHLKTHTQYGVNNIIKLSMNKFVEKILHVAKILI
jgi:hypothetical protein